MSHFLCWLSMLIGIVIYRVVNPATAITFEEHVSALYHGGGVLALHWFFWGRKEGAMTTHVSGVAPPRVDQQEQPR